jgi:hypothetical protein
MPDFEKKSEEKQLAPEESLHPELEKEKDILESNVLEKKQTSRGDRPVAPTTRLKIELGKDGQLYVYKNDIPIPIKVSCCFPWTQPNKYISLRDKDDVEIALIDSLDDLDKESRLLIEQALAEVGFVLEVERIEFMEEDFEIRNWKVVTKHGERTFQTKLDDWPRPVPGGGLLIRDVSSDLFYIPNPKSLDEKSRKILWAFLDEG